MVTQIIPTPTSQDGENKAKKSSVFPFAYFDKKDKLKIELGIFIDWLADSHYFMRYKRMNDEIYVRAYQKILSEFTKSDMKAHVKPHLEKERNTLNAIRRFSALFGTDALGWLPECKVDLQTDSKDASYLYFKNGFIEVTKEEQSFKNYSELDWYIWEDEVIQHDYEPTFDFEDLSFVDFIKKITSDKHEGENIYIESGIRYAQLVTTMGYLMHTKKDPAHAKAVWLVDEFSRPHLNEHNGRTGKGIISRALSKVRNTWTEDGKAYRQDNNRFIFQNVNEKHRLYVLDDVRKDFDFEFLYNAITGNMVIEKKGKQPEKLDFTKTPKFLITTNFIPNSMTGSSSKDRQYVITLSDYFSDKRKPKDEYGERFFDDWNDKQWKKFFGFMIHCIQEYFRHGVIVAEKSENYKESEFISNTSSEFLQWAERKFIEDGKIKQEIYYRKDMYENFISYSGLKRIALRTFGKWLKIYFEDYLREKMKEQGLSYYMQDIFQRTDKKLVIESEENSGNNEEYEKPPF